ncbi:MAG: hypothetical protein DELT_00950 [Desulfovibrio sp.]
MRYARFATVAVTVLALAALCSGESQAAAKEKLATRYLRAVHVMRHLYPGEEWPAVPVPRRIQTDDTTNALVKHRDTSFVLGTIVRDLTAVASGATSGGKFPEAGYYAAKALSRLGDHAQAAKTMKGYLAKAPFRDEDYCFLTRELYTAGDYAGVREAARTWQSLDASDDSCSEDRLMYVWGSFHAAGQNREAMEAVLSDPCASWKGQLFFARSSLAMGDEEGAEKRLEAVLQAFPDKKREIHMLWNTLASADRFP